MGSVPARFIKREAKVKLHKKGYLRLLELHNELALRTNGVIERVDLDYFLKKADKHGYTSMQAWCFVRDFGDVMYPGAEGFFDLEILIEEKDLANKGDEVREATGEFASRF